MSSTRQGRQQRTSRECRTVCGGKQDKTVSAWCGGVAKQNIDGM